MKENFIRKGIRKIFQLFFIYFIDNCNINWFLFSSKQESPHKSNVILLLSVTDSTLLQMQFTLFISNVRYNDGGSAEGSVIDLLLLDYKNILDSIILEICLFFFKQLKPKRKRVNSFNPWRSKCWKYCSVLDEQKIIIYFWQYRLILSSY